jgi:hypothetical protein
MAATRPDAAPKEVVEIYRDFQLRMGLLVDDNEDSLDLLSMLVKSAGHEVVVAHDGPQALCGA